MSGNFMLVVLVIVFVHGSDAAIENSPADVSVVYGGNVTILWKVGNPSNIITLTWSFVASNGTETILMDRTLNNAPTPKPGCNCAFNNAENGGITVLNVNKFGRYKIAVVYTNESPDEDEVLFNEILGCLICLLCLVYKILSGTGIGVTLLHVTIAVILIKVLPKWKVVPWNVSHVDWGVSVGGTFVHSFSLIVGVTTVVKNGDCRKCPSPVCDIDECDRCWKLGLASLVLGGIFLVVTIFFIILRKVSDKGKQSNDGKKDGASDQEMMGQPNNSL